MFRITLLNSDLGNKSSASAVSGNTAFDKINALNSSKQNTLKITVQTLSCSFNNSAVGGASKNLSGYSSIISVLPKGTAAQDIVITQVGNNGNTIAVTAYRLTGSISATVNADVVVIGYGS